MNTLKILKTPITYYGGKITMTKYILPLIPKHSSYVEPFLGGGAVFWVKEPSKTEVLNDFNNHVMNFYHVLKTNFEALRKLVETTLHSRNTYKAALSMYQMPDLFSKTQRAWAFWTLTSQGFSGCIGAWSYSRTGKKAKATANKCKAFTKELSIRLEKVVLECNDALKVIQSHDDKDTFFYIDPPYVGACQGHYKGYTEYDFEQLLDLLSNLDGKFLLSSYDSEMLQSFAKTNNWNTQYIEKPLTASKTTATNAKRKKKIEVLTMNYNIANAS
jgi:DNA adenine methylase